MTDDEIRQLVRSAIAKHLGAHTPAVSSPVPPLPESLRAGQPAGVSASFYRYPLPRAADDVMCLIEPAVKCNHCGYCECHGH